MQNMPWRIDSSTLFSWEGKAPVIPVQVTAFNDEQEACRNILERPLQEWRT